MSPDTEYRRHVAEHPIDLSAFTETHTRSPLQEWVDEMAKLGRRERYVHPCEPTRVRLGYRASTAYELNLRDRGAA